MVGTTSTAARAVVVGGSMAGLLAARVLADHFPEVVVVERDHLPDGPEPRRGVPQGWQPHLVLGRGRLIIERLFPGYGDELRAAGAVPMRLPADLLMLTPQGWVDRRARGWEALSAGRPLLEATVRRRLRQLSGVTLHDGHDVTALQTAEAGEVVTGVTARPVAAPTDPVALEADLVVDASGRGSRAATWLTDLGYAPPPRDEVDSRTTYSSRIFRIPDGFAADWTAVLLTTHAPSIRRSGSLFAIEGDRWLVTMTGVGGERAPADEDGWLDYARSLRHPTIAQAIEDAEPVSPIRVHHGTSNRRWHFERMRRRPRRFVVLGDAACVFNPIYGQGITVAALAAETLDACLRRSTDLDGLADRFQRRLARVVAAPWGQSTGEDLRFPTTTGMRANAVLRAQYRFLDRLGLAASEDPHVADVFFQVYGMLQRPIALVSPRVLVAAARARAGDGIPAPPSRPQDEASAQKPGTLPP
ncbi:NAD(P)/FAD-dependent oxidoreductase [Geodermatophilus sp. SYSU D00691]